MQNLPVRIIKVSKNMGAIMNDTEIVPAAPLARRQKKGAVKPP
jgi:hypothetical protein